MSVSVASWKDILEVWLVWLVPSGNHGSKRSAPLCIVPSCRSGFRVTSSHWPFAAEEPDSLQKVGDFISGPFILPFVVAVVSSVTFVGGGDKLVVPSSDRVMFIGLLIYGCMVYKPHKVLGYTYYFTPVS